MSGVEDARNTQQFLAGGHAALPQDSNGRPWTGDNVFSSGDLIEDLTHNFFLETVARQNKLRVYEMVEHPAAKALTGYLLVRGGVHQVAYARALENLTGANMTKLFPTPRIATEKIPECRPPEGALPNDLPPQPKAFVPDPHPEEIAEIAQKLRQQAGLPKEPTGEVNMPASGQGMVDKVKDKLT
jgi:Mn-containing catalase